MSIPKFDDFLMPVLDYLDQVDEAYPLDLMIHVKHELNLSEEDMEELIPNGKATRVHNLVIWAVTHLEESGLATRPRSGIFQITEFGRKEIERFRDENIFSLNVMFLKKNYTSFKDFRLSNHEIEEMQIPDDTDIGDNSKLLKFDDFLMPVLKYLNQVDEANYQELMAHIKTSLNLSEEDMKELVPTGGMTRVYNRVNWAVTHLQKAELVIRPRRGISQITPFGKEEFEKFRSQDLSSLSIQFLKERYESYRKFLERSQEIEEMQTSNEKMHDMPIPGFQRFLMPILDYLNQIDRADLSELMNHIKDEFNLSEENMKKKLPNRERTYVYDRVNWAVTYLQEAKLVTRPRRGISQITSFGKEELKEFKNQNVPSLNIRFLKNRYESFKEFLKRRSENGELKTSNQKNTVNNDIKTAQEKTNFIFPTIQEKLKDELLERIFSSEWVFFERMMVNFLTRMGFSLIHIQARRWKNQIPVSKSEMQMFSRNLQDKKEKKGAFITTSSFSKEAKEFAEKLGSKIMLINGDQLAGFMIESNADISREYTYQIKKAN